ncbi:unnamed protein product [Polarella glacialis]|uniref:Uncharacterized protein n=1 Tax=Polarella glacialis TaxID=89957 RepID=A0A813D3E6_POLGL|nr:unnamed protein product [Polarella glacialis]
MTSSPRLLRRTRAVLFDFDATLTVREELQVWRLFPERGGFGDAPPPPKTGTKRLLQSGEGEGNDAAPPAPVPVPRAVDTVWLRQKGFGGDTRISQLGEMFEELASLGVELHIVSFAQRDNIIRALSLLGMIHFFGDRIVGWQELGGPSKAGFIQRLMEERRWAKDQVLFVDDQARNIHEASLLCLTKKSGESGLDEGEMDEIRNTARGSTSSSASGGFGRAEASDPAERLHDLYRMV